VVRLTPLLFYTRGKSPQYPFYRRLGGSQSRSGGWRREILPLPGIKPRFLGRTDAYIAFTLNHLKYIVRDLLRAIVTESKLPSVGLLP
jgi:hypothetical protein